MILKVLIIVVILITLAFLGLGIGIFFSKRKKFPQISIGKNKEMHKLKITCVKHDELKACGIKGGCCGGVNYHGEHEEDDNTEE